MANRKSFMVGASTFVLITFGYQQTVEAQNALQAYVVGACGTPGITLTAGKYGPVFQNTSGTLCTVGSTGIAIATNITQIGGNPVNTAAAVTGALAVDCSTTGAASLLCTQINNPPNLNVSSVNTPWGGVSVGGVGYGGVHIDSSQILNPFTPSPSAALASTLLVKNSSGTLASFEVTADTTLAASPWFIMAFNSTTVPANGAVTPTKCWGVPSGTVSYSAGFPTPGIAMSTGIAMVISTTGCFTASASPHAFISVDFN